MQSVGFISGIGCFICWYDCDRRGAESYSRLRVTSGTDGFESWIYRLPASRLGQTTLSLCGSVFPCKGH